MSNNYIPGELFNKKTLFSLGGASLGVWLFTTVIGSVFNFDTSNYKWLGLIVALVLSFGGAFSVVKWNFQQYVIVFFNGLLIYVTACGIDSINHSKDSVKTNQIKSSIIPFTSDKIWWEPKEMTNKIDELNKIIISQNGNILKLDFRIKSVIDSCNSKTELTELKPGQSTSDYEVMYRNLLVENNKLKEINKKLSTATLTKKEYTAKDTTASAGKLNINISKANSIILRKTSDLCYNLLVKLNNFSSSGKYNPGTYNVSFLQKDIYEFQNYLEKNMEDINFLLEENNNKGPK